MCVRLCLFKLSIFFVFLLPFPALAVPVVFDFTNSGIPISVSTLNLEQQGLQLSISGIQDDNGSIVEASVFQNEYGIGLYSGVNDNGEIDVYGPDETMTFAFDRQVKLVSIGFSQVGGNDVFELNIDDAYSFNADIPGGNSSDMDSGMYYLNNELIMGSMFYIQPFGQYSEFTISNLTVATVAAPPALWLFALGLMGVVFRVSRKSVP